MPVDDKMVLKRESGLSTIGQGFEQSLPYADSLLAAFPSKPGAKAPL